MVHHLEFEDRQVSSGRTFHIVHSQPRFMVVFLKTLFKGSYLQDLIFCPSVFVGLCSSCELTTVIIETTSIIIPSDSAIRSGITVIVITATVQYSTYWRTEQSLSYYAERSSAASLFLKRTVKDCNSRPHHVHTKKDAGFVP